MLRLRIKALLVCLALATVMLGGCAQTIYTDQERFCARAAFAVSRHIGDIASFRIIYAEYFKDETIERVTFDCTMRHSNNTYERRVYAVGLGKLFEQAAESNLSTVLDESTGLYVLRYGNDYEIEKDETRAMDVTRIYDIFDAFVKSDYKDMELIGM
jgi:hypothetical protein